MRVYPGLAEAQKSSREKAKSVEAILNRKVNKMVALESGQYGYLSFNR